MYMGIVKKKISLCFDNLYNENLLFQKLYTVCDLALGLLNCKSGNITLKDVTIEPRLSRGIFKNPREIIVNIFR
jgi:hypothetical protein